VYQCVRPEYIDCSMRRIDRIQTVVDCLSEWRLPFEADAEPTVETVTQQHILTNDLMVLLKCIEAVRLDMKNLGYFLYDNDFRTHSVCAQLPSL
jgi:hypothetical protein